MWEIRQSLEFNTEDFERSPLVYPAGFREYDARWRYPDQINLLGFQCLGAGIATQLHNMGQNPPRIVVGHDYREYSTSIKQALILGLLTGGAHVYDIGLSLTPVANFARSYLDVPGVAMVTASHNENGWTGVKVGDRNPLTHGPEEMKELREIVMSGNFVEGEGKYQFIHGIKDLYIQNIAKECRLANPLKVVVAAGNGTAGLYAPQVLEAIGCEVVRLHCEPDWTFPFYNPNPEDISMLHHIRDEVIRTKAQIGFGFDGDGDRLGVVDDQGNELFSDKLGLLLARRLCRQYPDSKIIIDVKSTGLFMNDPILKSNNTSVEYWITGHSYMKRRLWEQKALAAFEKSGHFFFADPVGQGYDDGVFSAMLVCKMLDEEKESLSQLTKELPKTWQSPTMAPGCAEDEKYQVVDRVRTHYESVMKDKRNVCNQRIKELVTINGVRVILEDGTWGLVRASSNKPTLVIVTESPVSKKRMQEMFVEIDKCIRSMGTIGTYDQTMPLDLV